jgi:translation initiation factor IF-2
MAKIRVYELAKNLNMTNKALLTKIDKMNISVGSHMSSLDDETVELIKNNLFGKKEKEETDVDVKRVKSTVIRRRRRASDDESDETLSDDTVAVDNQTDEVPSESKAPVATATSDRDAAGEEEQRGEPDDADAESPGKTKVKSVKRLAKKDFEPARIVLKPVAAQPELDEKPDEPVAIPPAAVEPTAQEETVEVTTKPQAEAPQVDTEPVQEPVVTAEDTDENELDENGKPTGLKKKKKKFTAARIIKLPDPVPVSAATEDITVPDLIVTPATEDTPSERLAKKGKKGRVFTETAEAEDFSKKKSKRKTVVEGNALYAGGKGRKGRKGAKGGKVKIPEGQKTQITVPKAIKRRIKIDDTIVLAELAKRMGIKASEMIAKLMGLGVMATVNQTIDYDTAVLVASEFGFEVERASFEEDVLLKPENEDDPTELVARPPVVTIMGHVDHGKTSLLDVIRKTAIADGEAGGITQHIGAYNVETARGQIVFLDTPGHEAFTAMRARGAQVTDLVVLVVAADDGVMPQTIEALNHAKAAKVPIIVAVNKIDKDGADIDRVKRELSDHRVIPEDWGGDTIFVNVSAKKKIGITDLLDMILLQAEVLELKANPNKFAIGHVVESKLDSGRGPLATVLIQEGTLKTGQSIVCGMHYGKIRAMFNDQGRQVTEAGPSIPVEVIGLTGVPEAGDELIALAADKDAKQVSVHRTQKARSRELAKNSRLSLEGLFEQMEEGIVKELNLIIKADVHGSIEALKEALGKLATQEVKISVIHSATGTVTESDVSLAAVSNAIILGFNVRPATKVQDMAREEHVDMRFYDIIYDAIKDLRDAMVGLMESTFKEVILGRAEVRETFVIPKRGTIAGAYVTEGHIQRGQRIRLLRDGVIVFDGNISSLKRFKDDAKEVQHGYECGIGIENYNDLKVGDTLDCYTLEEVKPSLD